MEQPPDRDAAERGHEQPVGAMEPLAGGWSGETFLAHGGPGGEPQVVRIYARPRPDRADQPHEVDAALLRLVRGLLPVAEVLEVRRADPATGMPALLVTTRLPGERGDLVLPRLDAAGLAVLGAQVGRLAATLGGVPQLRPGPFVDGDLRIGSFGDTDGLVGWVEQHEAALAHWDAAARRGLREVAHHAQDLLDAVGRHCLVHSDLNPKNLLVDPATLRVTGLVDWEHAHAGSPGTDLGNALRHERHPAWLDAVVSSYDDVRGALPGGTLEVARAADLWALVDLAARRGDNPVAARAERLLHAIAGARDVHAAPEQ